VFSPSRVYSTALYPQATLSDPQTFLFLSSPRDAPIRLHSLLFPTLLSSYPLVNPSTEKYETPYSLLIPPSNPHTFLAGTNSQISIFDVNRNGDGPVVVLKTIPTRKSPMTTETMKGLVTALSLTPGSAGTGAGVLAAGTYTRQVGLYADDGRGDVIGVFALPEDDERGGGGGVTQLLWSQDGRYLYIAERLSDVVSVYDIRVTGMRVESFTGRNAATNQRIAVDVAYGLGGEVLGGGLDGSVKVWESGHGGVAVGSAVGGWQAHDDPVTSAVMHPSGSVMATCSGQRKTFGLRSASPGSGSDSDSDDSEGESVAWDNSLKIWEIPAARNSLEVG
jgi:WD40 repeat protein